MSQGEFLIKYQDILGMVRNGSLSMTEAETKLAAMVERYNREKSASQN